MNKEKVISYIKNVLAKNFVGEGIYGKREDSPQIYNALMSINSDTEYSKMSALLKLIKTQTGLNNKNLDDFIELLDKAATEEDNAIYNVPVDENIVEDITTDISNQDIVIGDDEIISNPSDVEGTDDASESAKGNVMVFVISLLILIIIILAVIIVLFC